MVEYLYNAIRATSATDLEICAKVSDEQGNPITEGVRFELSLFHSNLLSIDGEYKDGVWYFTIPAEKIINLKGKYEYCIKHNDEQLCFMQPIYLV